MGWKGKKREETGRNGKKQEELGRNGKKREEPGRTGKKGKETGRNGMVTVFIVHISFEHNLETMNYPYMKI